MVISDYGCYACHDIPGTEKLGRVGAELSNFGSKDPDQLAFGYAKEVKKSWVGFTKAKLKTPRIFETEVVVQKMPDFGLSDEELHALTVLLKSFVGEKIPKEFTKEISPNYADIQKGRKLLKKYNCIGCHEVVKGWGGENISLALRQRYDEGEAKNYAPPSLMGEGAKVQSHWLFKFIHEPSSIRPWLHLRMPTFNLIDDQVNSIVRYFQSVSEQNLLYHFWKEKDYTVEEKKELKTLFDMLQCIKCHQFGKGGEAISAAELAPDLSLTKERLKPKWVKDWLKNPQSLQPGTKMPNFFIDIDEEDGEVTELLPEPEEKIDLLLNYLYSLE
jgi:cytochrome c2